MQAEERAVRMLQAAEASQTELRSILRLEQIAIKGAFDPALLTAVELKELCSLVPRHLTWEPASKAAVAPWRTRDVRRDRTREP